MAVTHTETFEGAAASLEGVAPTTGGGVWAMSSANTTNYRIGRDGSGLGSGLGSGHKVAHLNSGAADHYAEMEYHGANANYGVAVRVVSHDNVIALRRWTGTIMQLIKRVGGTQTTVGTISGLDSWVAGDVFALVATGSSPVNVKVYKNGVQIGTAGGYDISDAVFSGVTNVGIWGADAGAGSSFDNWEAGTLVSDTLTIGSGPAQRQIYQRPASGDFALSLSGTFGGATPDDIEWRLEDQSGSLKTGYDWQSAAPTIGAGTWSLAIDVPADTDLAGYIVKLRSLDGVTVLAATQTNGFTVGDIWVVIGQSNAVGLFNSSGGVAPSNVSAVYDPGGGTWGVGSARIGYYLNALSALAGVPQGVCAGLGVNATGIRYHAPAHTSTDGAVSEGTNWPNIEDAVLALGDVRGELRVIGENDAGSGLAKQRQKDAFDAIRDGLKTLTGRGDGAFATLVMATGRDDGGSGTDSAWQAVREAQAEWCAATSGAYIAGDGITLSMADNLHYNTAGYVEMARRFARSAAKVLGGSAYDGRGPIVTGASIAGSDVTVTFDLNGSSALTGSGTLDGWEYYDGSWHAATDAEVDGNTVAFTGASATQVRYLYGADPEVANVARGDVRADASSPDYLPAEPTRGAVMVTPGPHDLTAIDLMAGTPLLGTPAFGQAHGLAVVAISTGTPTLGTPAVGQAHALTANPLDTGAPMLGAPSLSGELAFAALGVTAGVPALGSPTLAQTHVLAANDLATGVPALGMPSLTGEVSFTALGVTTGTPSLGAPTLSQIHVLAAKNLDAGTPTLGAPSLTGKIALTAVPLVAGSPTLGPPVVRQRHVFVATDAVSGIPTLGFPVLAQVHWLAANDLAAGAPSLGMPVLNGPTGPEPITPPERRAAATGESRRAAA